jgi:hypothetical protein|nr:MAG TPA: hypothetical protein [Caudoviricetes sp.]
MFNNYPQTSMQDMNLDWIIKIAKESKDILERSEKELREWFNAWIDLNYSNLMLGALYDEKNESILVKTDMRG